MKKITKIILSATLSIVLVLSVISPVGDITVSAQENLPAQFDQRNLGIVTPVKMQNPWGTCWASGHFAAGRWHPRFPAGFSDAGSPPRSGALSGPE